MAWNDPSPRTRFLPATSRRSTQPGYGSEPISFGRLVFRVVLAGIVGVLACLLAKACIAAWHGPAAHSSTLDVVLAFAIGFAVAALAWKYVMNRPVTHGLSARVRDGGGWGSGGYADDTFDNIVVADAAVDLVEVAVDVFADL